MAIRLRLAKALAMTIACVVLASACATTPTITPVASTNVASSSASQAPAVLAIEKPVDERIDFRLSRTDVACDGASLSLVPNTKVVSAHYVVDGQLGAKCFGRTNPVVVESWKIMAAIIPPAQLKELGVFVGYTNTASINASQSAVGVASSLGWASAGAQVSIDIDFAFEDEDYLAFVLVHEMGHVIEHATNQTAPVVYESDCQTFLYRGNCYYTDAMFLEWVALFWGAGLFEQVTDLITPTRAGDIARCRANPGFWTAYSASSPTEDFAEAYASFVLQVTAETPELQAKNDWFARRPELLAAQRQAAEAGYGPYDWPGSRCR